jgi:histone H2A
MAGKMAGKISTKGKVRRSGNGTKAKPVSSSKKAGTIFPVGRCNSYLKRGRYADRTGASAGAFMAAVLEYLTAEILEMAGDMCHQAHKKTIKPKHINVAIRSDEELSKLVSNTTISEGGMLEHINAKLLPNKGKKTE